MEVMDLIKKGRGDRWTVAERVAGSTSARILVPGSPHSWASIDIEK